jgi:hypothetical protein
LSTTELRELKLDASVFAESFRKILRLCFEPKKFRFAREDESEEELGDCDCCLRLVLFVFIGFHTMVAISFFFSLDEA